VGMRVAGASGQQQWRHGTISAANAGSVTLTAEGTQSRLFVTHTHPFNSPLSGTSRVSRYQKGKTNLNFTEARDGE